jgi:hypothetical protein
LQKIQRAQKAKAAKNNRLAITRQVPGSDSATPNLSAHNLLIFGLLFCNLEQ